MTVAATAIHTLDEALFERLRAIEYSRLDADDHAYLDYTGSALYSERQIDAHSRRMKMSLLGNPHSENGPSLFSTALINETKDAILDFLDAPADEYCVVFTANTSAAIKLVAESYPFSSRAPLVLSADNHNSMNGIREFARARTASARYIPLDKNLQLHDAESVLTEARGNETGLFGFPAQSNFSGIRHPLTLIFDAQRLGYRVLLDAAAFLPTSKLSLSTYPADFVALSIYKITGYPTGVGALVARRDAIAELERPWFAGGTVEYASIQHDAHLLKNHKGEGFEDGTPAFLSISAVNDGLEFLEEIGMERVTRHVESLSHEFIKRLRALRKRDGKPLAIIYGAGGNRGGTVAFNLLDARGRAIPFDHVVERARNEGVSVRGGCFCNPGASEVAFDFPGEKSRKCLESAADSGFTVERFSRCLGGETAVGAVRASMGIPTNRRDIDRALSVIGTFA